MGSTKSGVRTEFGSLRLNYTFWGPADLIEMDDAYSPAHAINAIIAQADVRMKKVVQTRVFPAVWQ